MSTSISTALVGKKEMAKPQKERLDVLPHEIQWLSTSRTGLESARCILPGSLMFGRSPRRAWTSRSTERSSPQVSRSGTRSTRSTRPAGARRIQERKFNVMFSNWQGNRKSSKHIPTGLKRKSFLKKVDHYRFCGKTSPNIGPLLGRA